MLENFKFYLEHYPLLALPLSFMGGMLASFTPCIYPVIPITVSYIGGTNRDKNKFNGFFLSLSYVLGMALTYSLLGLFAALSGKIFGQISANPWINFLVANLCIILGLNMLDVLPIPFLTSSPQFTSSRKGGIIGAFLLGLGSGFIAAPCTSPILAVLLILVAQARQVIFGFFLLFFFALGMGTLIILLGTFTGLATSLPKSGKWTENIKHIFGYALIAIGEYFLVQMGKYL